jgi:HlyD family secretion protein
MQKITRKKIIAFAAVAIAIFIVFSIVKSCQKGSTDKFEYEDVSLGKVEKTISVTGSIDVSGGKTILCKTNGIVKKINVEYNQEVKKGQLLAEIDTVDVDQLLKKLAAQLESLKLELTIAREDLESKKSMFKDNLISDKGLERAEFNYKTVVLKNRQFMVEYENARKQKEYSLVRSPIDGMVLKILLIESAPVGINSPLFLIVPSLKNMFMNVSVDESDIGLVKKDQRVNFTVSAFPEKTFNGKLSQVRITPVLKGALVTYESLVSCDNSEMLLKPGMTATATIEINKRENVLRVPNQALLINPLEGEAEMEKNTVWRKTDSTTGKLPVEKVKVEIGLRGDTYTEIKKNLKKGDKILIKFMRGSKGSGK